jgi:hypothetical protein
LLVLLSSNDPWTYNCGIICLFTLFGQPVEDVCVAAAVTCRKMVSDSLLLLCGMSVLVEHDLTYDALQKNNNSGYSSQTGRWRHNTC